MYGGELIAKVLKKRGVEFLFALCGGHISPILVGAKKQGIKVIDVRHEATAVFAADCYGRLTGIPGVAAVTAGPGVTNSVTAIKNAQIAQSPLILLGGAVATILKNRGALQDIEQIELYKTITKWVVTIEQDCDIIPILEEAFEVAASGVPGPVFIECPIDILYDEALVKKWYSMSLGKPKSISGKIISWYIKHHADRLFTCQDKEQIVSEIESIVPFAIDQKDLGLVLTYINNAKKPIMIIGSQALFKIQNVPNLPLAIERLGIPVYLTGMARGLLGENHKLNLYHNKKRALQEADLVILAGMPMDFRLDYGRMISRNAELITLNRKKEELKKNRKPTLGVQTDVSTFLIALANIHKIDKFYWDDWLLKLKQINSEGIEKINTFKDIETKYINPLKLCIEINKIIDNNSIIVGDGGDFVATASYLIHPKAPLSWLDPGPYGTLGVGAGFALAAKLVHPEKEIWLLYGDGAAGYSITEFDTFVRHKIPIIAVVGNDAGWTQITRDQVEYLKDDVGTTLNYSNYDVVAKGYGAEGIKIDS
ncbi:MAG TPA: thiamine pyrophosphate-binding protein [Candidatus Lokiarchaeia archaeon]